MYFRKQIISTVGLERVASHVYKAGTYSVLDNYLNYWWNYIVEWMPLWLAPNVITLIGTSFLLSTIPFGLYFSTTTTVDGVPSTTVCESTIITTTGLASPTVCPDKEVRSLLPIANLYIAFAVFMHQTLDAIDGKQARRTGSSSPLGQLFDHGCDALGACCISWNCAVATGLSGSKEAFLLFTSLLFAFFLAQWDEYHSHQLSTHVGGIGITEGQVFLMFFHTVAAFVSPTAWTHLHDIAIIPESLAYLLRKLQIGNIQPVPNDSSTSLSATTTTEFLLKLSIGQLLANIFILIIGIMGIYILYRVVVQLKHLESIKHLAGPLVVLLSGMGFVIEPFRSSLLSYHNHQDLSVTNPSELSVRTPVADTHTELLFLLYSLNITYMTTQVIVCSMTQEEIPSWQVPALGFPIVLYIAYNPAYQIYTYQALLTYLIFIMVMYVRYIFTVMNQITNRLGIRAFVITNTQANRTSSSNRSIRSSDTTVTSVSSSISRKSQRKATPTPSKRKST